MKTNLRTIVGRLNRLNILHRLHIHKAANAYGLYFGQLPILEAIGKNNNCTQKEISELLHVSPPSIATSVKRMQKMGLLRKVSDENDLRCTHLSLTEKGLSYSEDARKAFDKIDEKMFKGFSSNECDEFYNYIERLIENLSDDEEFKNETFFSLVAKMENLKKVDEKGEKDD